MRRSALLWIILTGVSACGGAESDASSSGETGTEDTGDGDGDSGDGDGDGDPGEACDPLPELAALGADWAALRDGVTTIDFGGGVPSTLIAHGPGAFPVIADAEGDVVVAASAGVEGSGGVVVWGHENLLGGQLAVADAGRLIENAARWAGGGDSPAIGVAPELGELATYLEGAGFSVTVAGPDALAGLDVYALGASTSYSEAERAALLEFRASGHGLLVGGQAWWWSSQNPGAPLSSYPGNQVLDPAGVLITADSWSFAGPIGPVAPAPDELTSPHYAIEAVHAHWLGQAPLGAPDLDVALSTSQAAVENLGVLTAPDYFCRAKAYAAEFDGIIPTKDGPLVRAAAPFEALALSVDLRVAAEDLPEAVVAHPAAADFPGPLDPDGAEPVTVEVEIDATHPGRDPRFIYAGAGAAAWRSTGVYAVAGQVIEVEVPPALVGQGVEVQIGSHSDRLWELDEWWRAPALIRRDPVLTSLTTSASAFGGLVYLVIPTGAALGSQTVSVSGGVPAPRYVHGATDDATNNAAWIAEQRERPGPWAELASPNFIITVPSAAIRELDDPAALMNQWEAVLAAQAELAGIPSDRPRAERFVLDRQISAGWMHSGYPIMAHVDSTAELVELATIQSVGIWGPLHELGHNHQWREFVLPGTTEANVNLWSVHGSETVLGIDRAVAHSALEPGARAARITAYLDGGANFGADWSVWTALETYLQLQEAFGWAPFTEILTNYYYAQPQDPGLSDAAKIDAFALEFGLAVDRDLGPFFLAWGFPLSQAVIDQLALLPAWAENPMP